MKAETVWPRIKAPSKHEDPAPGWTDPDLPDFEVIWNAARSVGYAVGLHGSMRRDCDLIAVPWVDEPSPPSFLVDVLCEALNARLVGAPEKKPQRRIAVTLQIDGWFKPIDLSIVLPVENRS